MEVSLIYRQSACLLAKVLRGAKAEDLPVEQPTNFDRAEMLAIVGQ